MSQLTTNLIAGVLVSVLAGCGGGGGGSNGTTSDSTVSGELPPPPTTSASSPAPGTPTDPDAPAMATYSVVGSVNGLQGTLEIELNSKEKIQLAGGTTQFKFDTSVNDGSTYSLSIAKSPVGQKCSIKNATGTISHLNTSNVIVSCTVGNVFSQSFGSSASGIQRPQGQIAIALDGTLWGTTNTGGANSSGVIYKIDTNGIARVVYSLSSAAGPGPSNSYESGLVRGPDGKLYGTSWAGGQYGNGAIFRVSTDGIVETVYSFKYSDGKGSMPQSNISFGSDGTMYGTAVSTGDIGRGSIFKLTRGGVYSDLHVFTSDLPSGDISAGATIVLKDETLLGVIGGNGSKDNGFIYRISKDGQYSVAYRFGAFEGDGLGPRQLSVDSSGKVYGLTMNGGQFGSGTIFSYDEVNGVRIIFSFPSGTQGRAFMVGSDGNFYATTCTGGSYGKGSVERISKTGLRTTVYEFGKETSSFSCLDTAVVEDQASQLFGVALYGGIYDKGGYFAITNQ